MLAVVGSRVFRLTCLHLKGHHGRLGHHRRGYSPGEACHREAGEFGEDLFIHV